MEQSGLFCTLALLQNMESFLDIPSTSIALVYRQGGWGQNLLAFNNVKNMTPIVEQKQKGLMFGQLRTKKGALLREGSRIKRRR